VEVIDVSDGIQPVRTVRSAIIGIVGTAPDADAAVFPLDKPILIAASRSEAAKLGATGTLPQAIDAILDQAGALIVVVRVSADGPSEAIKEAVIGGTDSEGNATGIQSLVSAESMAGYVPRILLAPGWTHDKAVADELISVAERLRAVVIIDAPNTTDQAAYDYAGDFGSARAFVVDPAVRIFRDGAEPTVPLSPFVAGLIAKTDADKGFWWSPSNSELLGIIGTARPIDFLNGDANSRANLLNEHNVNTVIRQNGFRFWGNRTCATDQRFAFLAVRRTADIINDSLQRACLTFVDRPISKSTLDAVVDTVNEYLRSLIVQSAILGGTCWLDRDANPNGELMQGKVRFRFKFQPPTPMEHLILESAVVEEYFDAAFA
jgi:phage tail sheath protein FI